MYTQGVVVMMPACCSSSQSEESPSHDFFHNSSSVLTCSYLNTHPQGTRNTAVYCVHSNVRCCPNTVSRRVIRTTPTQFLMHQPASASNQHHSHQAFCPLTSHLWSVSLDHLIDHFPLWNMCFHNLSSRLSVNYSPGHSWTMRKDVGI